MLKQRGVTLMELVIAMAVLGILAAAGGPAFAAMMRDARVKAAAEAWRDGLAQARIEAIRRNQRVSFVPDGIGYQIAGTDADGEELVLLEWSGAELGDAVEVALGVEEQAVFDGRGIAVPDDTFFRADFSTGADECIADGGVTVCLAVEAVNGFVKVCDPVLADGDARACELGG